VLDIIAEDILRPDLSSQPLSATYISDFQGIPRFLGDLLLELVPTLLRVKSCSPTC